MLGLLGTIRNLAVRWETGKEQVVQVHYDESLASYVAPEPCALAREGKGEASVGERAGQPLSRENSVTPGADVITDAEGNIEGLSDFLCIGSPP